MLLLLLLRSFILLFRFLFAPAGPFSPPWLAEEVRELSSQKAPLQLRAISPSLLAHGPSHAIPVPDSGRQARALTVPRFKVVRTSHSCLRSMWSGRTRIRFHAALDPVSGASCDRASYDRVCQSRVGPRGRFSR